MIQHGENIDLNYTKKQLSKKKFPNEKHLLFTTLIVFSFIFLYLTIFHSIIQKKPNPSNQPTANKNNNPSH
jgi:hypothetical protein